MRAMKGKERRWKGGGRAVNGTRLCSLAGGAVCETKAGLDGRRRARTEAGGWVGLCAWGEGGRTAAAGHGPDYDEVALRQSVSEGCVRAV